MKTQFLSTAKKLFLLLGVWLIVLPAMRAEELGEAAYYYLGDWPGKTTPGWNQDAQGLAHDRNNWFITQRKKIWKIPVGHDLNSNAEGALGVVTKNLRDVPELCGYYEADCFVGPPAYWVPCDRCQWYNHFGDPECYEFGGQTFLLVPLDSFAEGPAPPNPGAPYAAIALFRADTLAFVKYAYLTNQSGAPWCAVDPEGYVYSSNFDVDNDTSPIRKYRVEGGWERVITSGEFDLAPIGTITLQYELGSLPSVQGGVITPSGTLLYLMAGFDGNRQASDGIHVFDLRSGREVRRSHRQSDIFTFDWDPSGWPGKDEEPEGLTFWDLDDGRAPGISGQLHVLLTDNDLPDDDDILVKHYAGTLHVDRNWCCNEIGSLREPFKTVNKANDRIWDGAKISIRAGSYPETLTFSKQIKVVASGGPVTIGQ